MDGRNFDDLAKRLATEGISRRGLLRGLGGSLAAFAASGGAARAAKGGNSACAHFCAQVFGADTPAAGQCTSDAAHGRGLCYQCGPGGGTQKLCGQTCIPQSSCCTTGDCPSGQCLTCDATHTCVSTCGTGQDCEQGTCCTPGTFATLCAPGDLCGQVPDGCGGLFDCGDPCGACTPCDPVSHLCTTAPNGTSCGAGRVCADGSCCTPATCQPGQCGTVPANCFVTIDCGNCDASQCLTCGPSHTCVSTCAMGQQCDGTGTCVCAAGTCGATCTQAVCADGSCRQGAGSTCSQDADCCSGYCGPDGTCSTLISCDCANLDYCSGHGICLSSCTCSCTPPYIGPYCRDLPPVDCTAFTDCATCQQHAADGCVFCAQTFDNATGVCVTPTECPDPQVTC